MARRRIFRDNESLILKPELIANPMFLSHPLGRRLVPFAGWACGVFVVSAVLTAQIPQGVGPAPRLDRAVTYVMDSCQDCYCTEGLCPVHIPGFYLFVDRQGNQVIKSGLNPTMHTQPPSFPPPARGTTAAFVPFFSEGFALVSTSGPNFKSVMFIDKTRAEQFSSQAFADAAPFHEGVAVVKQIKMTPRVTETTASILDSKGSLTPIVKGINPDEALTLRFSEGLAVIRDPRVLPAVGFAYINKVGQYAFGVKATAAHSFHDGRAWVYGTDVSGYGMWGAIDAKGAVVIPFIYSQEPLDFSEGLAAVTERTGRIGFIDKTNTIQIPCQFRRVISPFQDGFAIVETAKDETVAIDKTGNVVQKYPRSAGQWFEPIDGLFRLSSPVLLMDRKGNVLIQPKYFRHIGVFADGPDGLAWATAEIDGHTIEGYINIHGDFIVVKGQSRF
jgi:hypothetical protein